MALNIPSIVAPTGETLSNAYGVPAHPQGYNATTDRVSVSFYYSSAAAAAGAPPEFEKDYPIPNSATTTAINSLAVGGVVSLTSVTAALLIGLGGDFTGATIVA